MRLTLEQIAQVVKAPVLKGYGEIEVTGVAIDSREATGGSLFVCMRGERVDGHDFAPKAVAAGCAAVLAERELEGLGDIPVLVVKDSVKALGAIAHLWRMAFTGRVVGITGTAGKTTLKEVLSSVLGEAGRVAKTSGNHNNQIGLPLSILATDGTEDFWVFEAGISHEGDMEELGEILVPDLAVVLNAGTGHTEFLGEKGVAWHKSRLFKYLAKGGRGIASCDYPDLVIAAAEALPGVLSFSAHEGRGACTAVAVGSDPAGTLYQVTFGEDVLQDAEASGDASFTVRSPMRGEAGAETTAAVSLAARLLGLSDVQIARGIASAVLPSQRFRREDVLGCLLIDDTYNANPLSMGRMLDAAAEEAGTNRPLVLVLGEMRELGADAVPCHRELGSHVARLAPEALFWKGGSVDAVLEGLDARASLVVFADEETLSSSLRERISEELLRRRPVVLFKGSRSNHLEKAFDAFKEHVLRTIGGKTGNENDRKDTAESQNSGENA